MALMYSDLVLRGYEATRAKVRKGVFPLVARIPEIDATLTAYKLAQDEYYSTLRSMPIKSGDDYLIDNFANLILYEELTWSHPDKMSIIEYPIISERNERSRRARFLPHGDLQYGDRMHAGRRKTHFTDKDGAPQVRNPRIAEPNDPAIDLAVGNMYLYNALYNAGLTCRQRQAIDLVYFEDMTQEVASVVMGIGKSNVNAYLSNGLRKLFIYFEGK